MGVKSKITFAVKTIVEQQMQLDDETLYVHVKSFKRYLKIQIVKRYLKLFKRNFFRGEDVSLTTDGWKSIASQRFVSHTMPLDQ